MTREELVDELQNFIHHDYCEDSWYSCPKAEDGCCDDSKKKDKCYCGAEEQREKLADFILAREQKLLEKIRWEMSEEKIRKIVYDTLKEQISEMEWLNDGCDLVAKAIREHLEDVLK